MDSVQNDFSNAPQSRKKLLVVICAVGIAFFGLLFIGFLNYANILRLSPLLPGALGRLPRSTAYASPATETPAALFTQVQPYTLHKNGKKLPSVATATQSGMQFDQYLTTGIVKSVTMAQANYLIVLEEDATPFVVAKQTPVIVLPKDYNQKVMPARRSLDALKKGDKVRIQEVYNVLRGTSAVVAIEILPE